MATPISAISAYTLQVQGFLVAFMNQNPHFFEISFISSWVHFDLPLPLGVFHTGSLTTVLDMMSCPLG